jgi:hypothetical protein
MERKVEGRGRWPAISVARLAVVSVGFVIFTFAVRVSGQSVEPNSMITLRVANYAHVPDAALAAAEGTARRLLHEAGVDTRWLECPLAGASVDPEPRRGPADFFLTVVSKMMREPRSRHDALGFALPCPQGRGGCLAYIFYSRIETMVADGDDSLSDTLGHVMAHEIGHLLLGPRHSPVGIMQEEWTREDLERAARDQLTFTSPQMELLRAATTVRTTSPTEGSSE